MGPTDAQFSSHCLVHSRLVRRTACGQAPDVGRGGAVPVIPRKADDEQLDPDIMIPFISFIYLTKPVDTYCVQGCKLEKPVRQDMGKHSLSLEETGNPITKLSNFNYLCINKQLLNLIRTGGQVIAIHVLNTS